MAMTMLGCAKIFEKKSENILIPQQKLTELIDANSIFKHTIELKIF